MKCSEYTLFFEGLNYEYGINNYPLNLKKALEIYKKAANNTTDTMSMFRLYNLYKNEFKKFNIPKRNRIYEKFYIFKCYSFLRYPLMNRDEFLCNKFDILLEISIHSEEEDENLDKFHKFIIFLNKNYKLYDINPKDLLIIESIIDYSLTSDVDEKEKALENLKLMSTSNLETLYKYTCFADEKEKEKNYGLLFDKQYYRSYIDYALFLNSKKRYKEALKILNIAKNKGFIHAGYYYYDIYLENIDFSLLIKEAISSSFSRKCELYNLFEILINEIIIGNVYTFFEFFFFRKICIKHYKLEKEFNCHFLEYTKGFVNFLIKITKEGNEIKKKDIINKHFFRDDFYQEYHLACGVIYFYGINNLLEIDNKKALNNFIISFKSSDGESYKRFCYFYIYKIRKIIHDNNKIKNCNFINENIIKDTEKEIFKMYYNSLNEDIRSLSSSYFYYLSRLLNKKVGNDGDKLLKYICLNKAKEFSNYSPGLGSIISFYRRYKSKVLLDKNKEEYSQLFKNIIKYNDSEGYGEDGTFCPICFENKRNEIALPCKHLFCNYCINKVDKCPICRSSILMKHILG